MYTDVCVYRCVCMQMFLYVFLCVCGGGDGWRRGVMGGGGGLRTQQ